MKRILIAAMLLTMFMFASANATVITFDPLTSTTTQSFVGPYVEAGFQFSAINFGSWGSSETNYTGSQALLHNSGNGVTTLSKVGGGAFSFNSVDLSEAYNQSSYPTTTVVFNALLAGGGTATYTATLDGVFGNQNFSFGNIFDDIASVSWTQTYNYHQFDNLVLDATSVPEPATMLLLGFGLIGLAGIRRKFYNLDN